MACDPLLLNQTKERQASKKVLQEVASFCVLKQYVRVPRAHQKRLRRAKKTTFVYKNTQAFRVVKDSKHLLFLQKFSKIYSSSANKSTQEFSLQWAKEHSDVWVMDARGLYQDRASRIYKFSKTKVKKLR
ncbi:Sua5 YciO YrdC YwlC family protein [Helicobacter mustelae]|nr:Sua5 YciO YrdC YwlC family protein [Helicobacter mustelae]